MAHIIIADDDEIVRDIVRDTFAEYGHVVGCVADGAAALEAIAATRPNLVIMDCTMPRLCGLLALRRIRVSEDFYALPVLMLTANRGKADVDLALREGADGYVKKPFDPHQLVFRAEELIEEKQKAYTRHRAVGAHGW